jgi:hypothetical protein
MAALSAAHDAAMQMIDTSVVRVHQHGACIAGNRAQQMGRSRGGLSTKIHAVVDGKGLPVQLGLTSGRVGSPCIERDAVAEPLRIPLLPRPSSEKSWRSSWPDR